ncbi:MAG: glycosyltransferase [Ginsengibacter sp.]
MTINTKSLHIVCHDVPYPTDYGGVYDLFYKIKSLYKSGISLHLHCFEYGRGSQVELTKYCKSVTYYKRKSIIKSLSFRLPYIVSSRADTTLLNNLLKDDHPILLEGIHCTYFLFKNDLKKRKVLVRLHNVEYEYYNELAKSTKNIFKKIYFFAESKLLKRYEKSIANKAMFISVSEKDKITYIKKFNSKHIEYLPVFLPFNRVTSEVGKGVFCLYHGNLSVSENEKAGLWMLKNIFESLTLPLVIAGKNPSEYLNKIVQRNNNVCLVANPSQKEMDELIKKAHIHILPSFNKTGIKIKLLNALINGRFVVANTAAAEGLLATGLCKLANSPAEYIKLLPDLFKESFSKNNIEERKQILESVYDNDANARQLMQWIW